MSDGESDPYPQEFHYRHRPPLRSKRINLKSLRIPARTELMTSQPGQLGGNLSLERGRSLIMKRES